MPTEPSRGKNPRRAVQIGKYEVVTRIASGGMGAVYKALDRDLGREVALKVLPPEMAANPTMIERFRREARHAAQLRHENIVSIYEFGESAGTYYLALEFVDGIDLQQYIDRQGTVEVDEALDILRQALRALDHAFQQGIVHRDVKPSNFLLARKDNELIVKLADMGLAQNQLEREDEHRVTRAGTTVGTVDYMSPEQARDSASADIRSDLYSLGCTLFHMLTGQAPFPQGSLTERLYKHIEAEPPDVRTLNAKVPAGLVALLGRLLAKKPKDRYQTPAEVLDDLANLDRLAGTPDRRDLLAGLTEGEVHRGDLLAGLNEGETDSSPESASAPPEEEEDEAALPTLAEEPRHRQAPRKRSHGPRRAPPGTVVRPTRQARPVETPAAPRRWLLYAGIGAAVVVAAVVAVLVSLGGHGRPRSTEVVEAQPSQRLPVTPTAREPEHEPDKVPPKKTPVWNILYTPATPLDAAAERRELEAPWAADRPLTAEVPAVAVSRSFLTAEGGRRFGSLAAAAADPAEKNATTVYEIQDTGPLFEPASAWSDRHVVVRGGAGRRPLLVWDVGQGKDRTVFLSVTRGSLTLENLDVVLNWPETAGAGPAALLRVVDGDLTVRGCTFSVAGSFNAGLALARLEGTKVGCRCRLRECYARGAPLTALDLQTPGAEALLEDCLVVGGDQPLVQILGRNQPTTTVRTARTTLVGGPSFLSVRAASASDTRPALRWLGWDTLLARSRERPGGDLIDLGDNLDPAGLKWRGLNCLYAGWKTLLRSRELIAFSEWTTWRQRVQTEEGDRALDDPWPLTVHHDPAEQPPANYEVVSGSTAAYAATPEAGVDPGPLGCPPKALPPGRVAWLALAAERSHLSAVSTSWAPGEIPAPVTDQYQGEFIDRNRVEDLGEHFQKMQRTYPLGPKVVLRLTGSGDWSTSPIHVKGSSLVLRFEETRPDAPPLALLARSRSASEEEALITVEGGDLEIDGGEVRMPGLPTGLPAHLLKVTGGNLRIRGSRLVGALAQSPDSYHSLISWEGSGEELPDKARIGVVYESVLLSGRGGIEVTHGGARLHVEQSVVVAGGEAFRFHLDGTRPRVNVQVSLDHATIAARKALFAVGDAPALEAAREPLLVQATASAFLAPFPDVPARPTVRTALLLADGEALGRGLVLWQGEGNVYDRRLYSYLLSAGAAAERQQQASVWTHLWGTLEERQGVHDLAPSKLFDPATPQLERLAMLPGLALRKPLPGADLTRAVFKKPLRG